MALPRRGDLVVVSLALAAATCGGPSTPPTQSSEPDYPDAITRTLERLAAEPRPVPRSALPPRHLDTETFPVVLVDRDLIVSGGPPPDGIRAIDEPRFRPVPAVDWLHPDEPMLKLTVEGETRAYPYRVMLWHEIVNDVVAGRPVVVTFCPLCNSGLAFDRVLGGEQLDFGTSGSLYQSALVMYDRQTESLCPGSSPAPPTSVPRRCRGSWGYGSGASRWRSAETS